MTNEIVTVYPAVPPKPGGYSSPGSILVTYEVPESEDFIRGYFSFTLRTIIVDGQPVRGTMDMAIEMAQDMLRSHLLGEVEISPECLWRDPADQRQAEQNRKTYEQPPAQNTGNGGTPPKTTPDGKPIKTFVSVKVEKERDPKNKKTYIGFYMSGHNFPDTKVTSDAGEVWDRACEQLQKITGMDWHGAELGTALNREMVVGYTDAKNTDSKGNPYKDFYGVKSK